MNKIKQYFPAHLRFLIYVWLVLVVVFMFCRYAALFYIRPDLVASDYLGRAFWVGGRFDIQVACYGLLVPFFALFVAFFLGFERKWLGRAIRFWCIGLVIIAFVIAVADIPYFQFFNSRLTTAAVQWSSNVGQQLRFLLTEVSYYPFYFVGIIMIYATGRWVGRIWKKTHSNLSGDWTWRQKSASLMVGLVLLYLGCFGFRAPALINLRDAEICPEGFLNQLSLNPVHTWFNSMSRFDINYVTVKVAVGRVQESLGIKKPQFDSPIARKVTPAAPFFLDKKSPLWDKNPPSTVRRPSSAVNRPNVVLILVESLSAAKMGVQGNQNRLTPRLDQLAQNQGTLFFDNFFSVGIHTSNGLFGSLFSYPVHMSEHPMNSRSAQECDFAGMPRTLKTAGYRTSFFCTHGKEFDNIGPFFERNGFDFIVDKSFYPPEKQVGAWGIPDEVLLDGAFGRLDSMSRDTINRQPIFSTILTITTHPPYQIPEFSIFKTKNTDKVDATFEYTDWALGRFFDSCATRDWYKNTIFVMCGDHGLNTRQSANDVDMSYNHIPFFIHAPGFLNKNERNPAIGMQIDIFPTVMGMLGKPWVNNTLGVDLLREKRPFAYFSQDTKMGVVDAEHLYVIRKSGSTGLYNWKTDDPTNIKQRFPELARAMRDYGCSMLQTSNFVIDRKLTGDSE